MIIYNSKEMETKYMAKDEVVIEIHSLLSPEELLTKLRAGEDLSDDEITIAGFSVGEGAIATQAEFVKEDGNLGYNTVLSADEMEELEDENESNERNKMFQAFEAYQFNRPWRAYEFQPCEITREQLASELYAALGIMPTIKDIPDKSITELKRMSASGDRLYWGFADVTNENKLPTRTDIEFYESLSDYEKRVINESGVHPMKLLQIARGIKEGDPGRLFTLNEENAAHSVSAGCVIANSKVPGTLLHRDTSDDIKHVELRTCLKNSGYKQDTILETLNNKLSEPKLLSDIARKYVKIIEEKTKEEADTWKVKEEENLFCWHMSDEYVIPQNILDKLFSEEDEEKIAEELLSYYKEVYHNEFLSQHTRVSESGEMLGTHFDEIDMEQFAKKAYRRPMPKCISKADEIFKELFHGHSPRVLSEYMFAQFLAKGIRPEDATEKEIRDIAEAFNQKNVSKVAKYKNAVLFALADKLNYNEVKEDHMQAMAIFITPGDIKSLLDKGFVEWYIAHKNMNVSNLVEVLNVYRQIPHFDLNKSAQELAEDINQAKGKADCRLMEQKYGYRFADNEIAIRGRHIVAQEGKLKMYMLDKKDYRNFTVGYDTSCCQHYGNAGESCVYKLTSDPFAACVVIERDGAILAQGFVWTDEAQDTLVFDNVEFADDRKVGQFNSLFAAWCRAMPYKNIHVGVGYNQGMHSWGKKVTYQAILPTTLNDNRVTSWGNGNCYSDYHPDARSLKFNGSMQISEKSPVKITRKEDEPTRWDILARPETAFLLNDCHSSIESRLEFARNFLNEQTPEIQMEAVKRTVFAIRYIENPTEDVQKYVIRQDPKLAGLIKNPCRAVQKLLIDEDPTYIRNISNPSEEMVRKAVMTNGLLLADIENPSETAIKLAVEQNGYAIRFVQNQTEELQEAAVRSNPKVVSLLDHPSEDIQKMAINADPSVISLIQHPSSSLQLFAVERDPYTINSIEAPDYNAIKKAVEKNGLLIRNFQYTYPHLREVALNQNGFAIRALKNPTDEEYVIAVRQNRAVANTIRDPELRSRILEAVQTGRPVQTAEYEMELG